MELLELLKSIHGKGGVFEYYLGRVDHSYEDEKLLKNGLFAVGKAIILVPPIKEVLQKVIALLPTKLQICLITMDYPDGSGRFQTIPFRNEHSYYSANYNDNESCLLASLKLWDKLLEEKK